MAFNADGCIKGQQVRAGAGRVLRDTDGAWLRGFIKNIDICSFEEAELWVIWRGLILAQELQVLNVEVRSDSARVIDGSLLMFKYGGVLEIW